MSLVAESHGVTGRQAPAATVLHAIENLGHGRLGRKPFQVVEKVFLQAHPRRPGTTAGDLKRMQKNVVIDPQGWKAPISANLSCGCT